MSSQLAQSRDTYGGKLFSWSALRHKGVIRFVAAAILGVVSLGAWAMSSPAGSEPDSDFHMASIYCTTLDPGSPCDMEERRNQKMVPAAVVEAECFKHDPTASAACQPLMTTADDRLKMTDRLNIVESNANYPSGFYLANNVLAGENVDTSIFSMRMLSVALFVGLNLALWLLLPIRLREPLTWAWAASLVPLGLFVISSTNPSSWSLIGVGSAWLALLGYLEAHGYRRWVLGGLFLIFVLLAVASRTDATLFAIATSGLALFVSDAPFRQIVRRLWIPAVGAVLAAIWLFFQRGALGVLAAGIVRDTDYFNWDLFWNNLIEVPGLWMGSFGIWPWGALGWLDTPMPQLAALLAFTVFTIVVGIGVTGSGWRVKMVTFVVLAMMWFYPIFILQQRNFLVGESFQARYGLPLLVVLIGVAVLRSEGHRGLLPLKAQRIWVVGALTLANSLALHQNIRRYVTGLDVQGFNLNSDAEWWWWGLRDSLIQPMGVWLVGSVAFGALAWLVVVKSLEKVPQPSE